MRCWIPAAIRSTLPISVFIATEGYLPLRRSIAAWQSRLGKSASPEQILVVSGSQQGLFLIVKSTNRRIMLFWNPRHI